MQRHACVAALVDMGLPAANPCHSRARRSPLVTLGCAVSLCLRCCCQQHVLVRLGCSNTDSCDSTGTPCESSVKQLAADRRTVLLKDGVFRQVRWADSGAYSVVVKGWDALLRPGACL